MRLQNTHLISLEELQQRLANKYPKSVIKKPFLTPRTLIVDYENFKMLIRDKNNQFITDFNPPVLWLIGALVLSVVLASLIFSFLFQQPVLGFGGALWIIIGLVLAKVIFKSFNKSKFEQFEKDIVETINRPPNVA